MSAARDYHLRASSHDDSPAGGPATRQVVVEARCDNSSVALVRRADGIHITDIDAVAARNRDLLLISCKSVASTLDLVRGSHAAVRNFRKKAERAVAEWDAKVTELREGPERLGLSRGDRDNLRDRRVPDLALRRRRGGTPATTAAAPPARSRTSELEDALKRRR